MKLEEQIKTNKKIQIIGRIGQSVLNQIDNEKCPNKRRIGREIVIIDTNISIAKELAKSYHKQGNYRLWSVEMNKIKGYKNRRRELYSMLSL